ncbi:hypothetical protein N7456_002342 [Penicillium angulare]|uniref:Short-chain dehydrogenase/reductase 3 n=1 Tax=Penicillium angulare TaxID=116970 RepID=A0A9W9G8H3_9EURO|nr:hypothetical protein N7456_002342 [Penicillium angulare]
MSRLVQSIQTVQPVLNWLKENPKSVAPLAFLLGLTLVRRLNNGLNNWALNNIGQDRQWDWRREIVLITGGSNGIGELVARKLAKKSVKVVVLDLRPPTTPFPANVSFYKADVTSTEALHQVAGAIRQEVGNPTVLVNNAGVASMRPILEEKEESVRRTFDVNCVALFILAKEFLPSMIKENHGHVLTMASMASFVTLASNVDYGCSKAAALTFHEGLTQELKHRYNAKYVRTSVVHPSWVRTPMLEPVLKRGAFMDTILEPSPVADAVVAQILGGKSGQIFLPASYSSGSMIRGFPTWFQEMVRSSRKNVLEK